MTEEQATLFDIAIVGLGPVGSGAAVQLARTGLSVVCFDRDTEVYLLPRAVNMDGEIIRGFQRIGLGEELNSLMQGPRPNEWVGFVKSDQSPIFGRETKPGKGVNGWQSQSFFDQPEVDGWLRGQCIRESLITTLTGWEVTGVVDNGDQVEVQATDLETDDHQCFQARYVIACDGASSQIRRGLGIEWQSLGYDQDWLVIDITLKPGNTLGLRTAQVCDPDRLATYVCTKDPYRRWEFRLNPGETAEEMMAEERVHSLLDPWTPRGTYDIRRTAVYTFHAATAASWRQGRILLAGDSAHQTPPFLGQGMNTGMRDILNLAWKLPLVIAGKADDRLLDSYQAERDAHARDLVDWAVSIGRLMEYFAEVEQAENVGGTPPEPMDQSSGYGQGRSMPPLRNGAILDQSALERKTGYLFAQPDVKTSEYVVTQLDELLGSGFAIVCRDQLPAFSTASKNILKKLDVRILSTGDLTLAEGQWDKSLHQQGLVIVRPDRYVFASGELDQADELVALLAQHLYLTWGETS